MDRQATSHRTYTQQILTYSQRHAQSLILMMTHIVRAHGAVDGVVDFVINAITNTQHPFGGKFSSRVEQRDA